MAIFVRTPGVALIRRDKIAQAGEWNKEPGIRGSDDWEMWLRLSEIGDFVRVPSPVLQYRVHAENMSANRLKMHLQSLVLLQMERARQEQNGNTARAAEAETAYRTINGFTSALYWQEVVARHQNGNTSEARALLRQHWRKNGRDIIKEWLVAWHSRITCSLMSERNTVLRAVSLPYRLLPAGVRRRLRRGLGIIDP